MITFFVILRRLGNLFKRLTVGSLSTAAAVIIYGTFSEYYLERGIPQSGIHSLFSSLWWTMQTLTTVGYGDTPVYGYLGRLNAIFIMVIGIGSLGVFLASMSASITNVRLKQRIGIFKVKMKEHVIVCNYQPYAHDTIKSIISHGTPVVAVCEDQLPNSEPNVEFLRGSCLDDDTLERAGIKNADSAIILAGMNTEPSQAAKTDAMTIMMAMKIRRSNPETFTIAEILLPKSVEHAENAGVDEPIIRGSLSLSLISRSIYYPGLSKALMNLVSDPEDIVIGEEKGAQYRERGYGELSDDFLKRGRFIIGLQKGKTLLKGLKSDSPVDCDRIIYVERKF